MDKTKAPLVGAFLLEYAGDVSYISDHFFIIDKYTAEDKVVFDEADPSLVEAMKEPEPVEETPVVEPAIEEVQPVVEEVPEVNVESPVANIFSDEAEHRSPVHDTETFCDLTGFQNYNN
ncbi:hypothetical protein GQN26_21835 [Escherichia coli]|uniref:hypothetical protein n=1 Tax=Escherichia coli TaxID=562 RepID=UPI001324B5E6|nr:hypothetical protein [Escherichia coli]MWO33407.1 hypothetical protein [Escherichia coli]MWP59687.1 hypothetical protein [Escherichia coli]